MTYDVDTLLAAFQASFIYIIVQGEGAPSLTCNSGVVHSILNNCAVGLSLIGQVYVIIRLKLTDLG